MNNLWIRMVVFSLTQYAIFAQCSIEAGLISAGPNLSLRTDLLGRDAVGGILILRGSCPGEPSARVRYKVVDFNSPLIMVSPSEGVTPMEIEVGVTPNLIGESYPGTDGGSITFSTVDQSPARTARVGYEVRRSTSPQPPAIASVVNAASMEPVVTPGGLVWIRGTNFSAKMLHTLDSTGRYPTTLARTTVTFNGIPAPLLMSGPGAILAVAPNGIKGAQAAHVIVSQYPGTPSLRQSSAFSAPVAAFSLGIFDRVRCPDCPDPIQNCDGNGCTQNTSDNPARRGSVVMFFATGVPLSAESRPEDAVAAWAQLRFRAGATIGGQPAQILYAGSAPGRPWGVYQVNVRVPDGVASGAQPLVLTLDVSESERIVSSPQGATVAIK